MNSLSLLWHDGGGGGGGGVVVVVVVVGGGGGDGEEGEGHTVVATHFTYQNSTCTTC